jgi:HPt (histidine-containing phosphotransfer) domain-containing protein
MTALEERIRALRKRYISSLPERATAIGQLLVMSNASARAELLRELHVLAGTAGSFGYHDITANAREAEHVLAGPNAGAATGLVEQLVARLRELHDASRNEEEAVAR